MKRIDGTQIIRAARATQYLTQERWWFELKDGTMITVPCTLQGWIDVAEMEPPQGIDCAHYLHGTNPYFAKIQKNLQPKSSVTVGQFYGMRKPNEHGLIEMINENGPKEAPEAIMVLCNRWQPMPVGE